VRCGREGLVDPQGGGPEAARAPRDEGGAAGPGASREEGPALTSPRTVVPVTFAFDVGPRARSTPTAILCRAIGAPRRACAARTTGNPTEDHCMHLLTWPATALALVASLAAAAAPGPRPGQADGLRALDGEWLYVEDRTEGRASEQQGPPMSSRFALRVEEDALVMVRTQSADKRETRIALDGSVSELADGGSRSRVSGLWKDGAFEFVTELVRPSDDARTGLIVREFRPTAEGLLVRVMVDPPDGLDSLALYRHPQEIPLPAPAKAVIADMDWLTGAWVGARGSSSTEERWTPPLGGAMLGVSRTVKNGAMSAFEYLRIVERDGGLVYVAQPNGRPPTEFVLTELSGTRAVFENPRHDSPQRIVYELSGEGRLSASIGYIKGGKPQRFEFERDGG
jgi:hypothetical protein